MSRFPVFVINMGKMTKLRQNGKLPCGTKFLLVLIFAILPAIRGKNKLPINWNFLKHFSRKNSLQSNASVNSSCAQPAPGLLRGICPPCQSRGWGICRLWLLRLSAKILALLRLSLNFFQLRLTKKLIIYFFCFKGLNINQRIFFVSFKQNKGFRIISGWNKLFFWKRLTFDRSYFL